MTTKRSLIVSVLGHVDHGKSSILDKIRGTAIVKSEAGAITQAIGASIIPKDVITKICGNLLNLTNQKMNIPGLLFIDTPGHAAFSTLRKRGGSLADIAIVVIDINEGFKPQTLETIEILKTYKTPFIVAANKLDLVSGWKTKDSNILQNIQKQDESVKTKIDEKIYTLVGTFYESGFNAERFDRVDDYTSQIAIVPCSAKTGEGIPELLMVLTGLTQKFLTKCLDCDITAHAKGTILEVKEEKGLGTTLDAIIYNGHLKVNDTIVIGSLNQPIVTKIKALLIPAPLKEMRDKKTKFLSVKNIDAAMGVKISAPDIDNVIAGMPIRSATESDIEQIKEEIQKEVDEVLIETDKDGIIIKADTLGSLEALTKLLKEKEINIRKASIGNITKKDLTDCYSSHNKDPFSSVILGFNITIPKDLIIPEDVKLITNSVIYRLIEDFEIWLKEKQDSEEKKELKDLIKPSKIKVMPGYVFRQSNPAVCGIEIINGTLETNTPLMNNKGKQLTTIKGIELEKKSVSKAERNQQVAVSMSNVTIGRQLNEGDFLYSNIPEEDFRKFKELKKFLTKDEVETLKEIAIIKRKDNPIWGI